MLENSKWITRNVWREWSYPERAEDFPRSPYIVKTFFVRDGIKRAVLNIAALGQGAYYVNSVRIPDSYLPTVPQNPMKAVLYNTYDILSLLTLGENRVGVILGNNGFCDMIVNRYRSQPKLTAEIILEYENGESETIMSDTSWKTADSPTLFSMRRCGEKYDARLAIDGWCSPETSVDAWDNADICQGPGGALRKNICPPMLIKRGIKGKELRRGLFDFGMSLSGWVKISVKGACGEEIVIKYAERLSDDGAEVDQSGMISAYEPMSHKDRYIIGSNEGESFEQLFSYHGFRYAEITGNYDELSVEAVSAYTDIKQISDFKCDNDTVNKIHSATVNSLLTNSHGALTDCPHREQNEWTGDGALSAETVSMLFDAHDMLKGWMDVFRDEQFPNGKLPCIIPAKNWLWEYNFASGTDWDSAIFHIPYYLLKYGRNSDVAEMMWESMNKSLSYFSTLSENCLMRNGVGDWCALEETCDKEITDTAYYRADALMMSEMAEYLGKDGAYYSELAERIKSEFRKKYVRNGEMTDKHEAALAAAIYAGFLNEDEIPSAAAELAGIIAKNGYRFTCGVHGLRFIFDALSENGYTQLLFDTVTNRKYPGYAMSVENGMNSLPERFDLKRIAGEDSLNHHFRSPVAAWFYKYLAGIRIDGFFEKIIIEPHFVNGISELTAELNGIKVSYDPDRLTVDCPYDFVLALHGKQEKYSAGKYGFDRKGNIV